MEDEKYCIDCKWHHRQDNKRFGYSKCLHPEIPFHEESKMNFVTGKPAQFRYMSCKEAREWTNPIYRWLGYRRKGHGKCGPKGKYWEPKDE